MTIPPIVMTPQIALPLLACDLPGWLHEQTAFQQTGVYAIPDVIAQHLNQNPVCFNRLAQRLKQLGQQQENDGEVLQRLLLKLRDTIAANQQQEALALGLSAGEYAFYSVLLSAERSRQLPQQAAEARVTALGGYASVHERYRVRLDPKVQAQYVRVAREIMVVSRQATQVVDFFNKPDEIKTLRKWLRRRLINNVLQWPDTGMLQSVTERCMQLVWLEFKPS